MICRLFDQSRSGFLTLNKFKVGLTEAELDFFPSFRVWLGFELILHALKCFFAHDPCLEDESVTVELVLFL